MGAEQQVLIVKDKVSRYLSQFVGGFEVSNDGSFSVQSGSARLFIKCTAWNERFTGVSIQVWLLADVPDSPELWRYIAFRSPDYKFGQIWLHESQQTPGTVEVLYTHELLGDYLDSEELNVAVATMAAAADALDNDMQSRFGGRRYHEEVA